jgi:hypothetical protein
MALGNLKETDNMSHLDICICFVLQMNIGTLAERVKQSEDKAREEADKLASTSSASKDKS